MNVALYARVSKDEASSSGQLQDPENQLLPLRKYCEARGFTVKDVFVDRASGGDANRPSFRKMLGLIRQNRFRAVVVWSLDRFSREGMTNTLSYIRTLKSHRCGLISLQESWLDTTNDGVGELLVAIFAWVAAEEKRKIGERTRAALAKKKAQGFQLGRPKIWERKDIKNKLFEIWGRYSSGEARSVLMVDYNLSKYGLSQLIKLGKKRGVLD